MIALAALFGIVVLAIITMVIATVVRTYKELEGIYRAWLIFCLLATALIVWLMIETIR